MPHYIPLSTACEKLRDAERVLVVGCSGGGKTTLALKIAERFNLKYRSIDRDVYWLPGWRVRDDQEQRAILKNFVMESRWIMDGNNPSTFDLRVPRADLIIWLRIPRVVALVGLARRVLGNFGRARPMMAEGCPEPIPDREFLSYIWNFERNTAPKLVRKIDEFGPAVPTVAIKSRRDFALLIGQKQPLG